MVRSLTGFTCGFYNTVYDRSVCNRFQDLSSNICLYDDFKLYSWYSGKGRTTDEYVCSWYADENTGWFWSFISYNFTFAWNRQFYIYQEMKKMMVLFIEGMY